MFIACLYTKFQKPCPNIPLLISATLPPKHSFQEAGISLFHTMQNIHNLGVSITAVYFS